jgi:2'-5' RNA ligase
VKDGFRRVFLGLPAPAGLQEAVLQSRSLYSGFPFRWTAPEHLHVTLVPPWQCPDIGPVCAVISETALRYPCFSVVFNSLSPGPSRRKPRLLWATAKAPLHLLQLRRELALGFSAEADHDFFLHMTVARFRPEAVSGILPEPRIVFWPGTFDRICLYESLLYPSGAVYRELCSVRFVEASRGRGN